MKLKLKFDMEEELKKLGLHDLEVLWEKKRNELYAIKRELDHRTGKDQKPSVDVDYTKYVTK